MPHKKIFPFHTIESMKIRIEWFVNLRWYAVLGIIISVPAAQQILLFEMAYAQIMILAALISGLNLIYTFVVRYYPLDSETSELVFAEIQIIIDFICISFLIHFAGGINNPFYFLYIVHVILSGILFPGIKLPLLNTSFAAILLTGWTLLETGGIVERYQLEKEPISASMIVTSLIAFYITTFAGIYIIKDFLLRFRRLKQLIDQKNEQLEEAIKERSRIFRYAAHELKSPLSAVHSAISVVQSLYTSEADAEAIDLLERAEKRTSQVLKMIKEMITITQYNLEAGEIKKQDVNINELVKEIITAYKVYAEQKNIFMNFIPLENDLQVETDPEGMEIVLNNLIGNAIKYTPGGGRVTVEVFRKGDVFGIRFIDTGIGISKEDLPKIFNEFYRTKEARRIEQIGTGLGLNLVKEILDKNNGCITVESEPNVGSTFTIYLPVKAESYIEANSQA